jgi:LuxR family transcriptional regulator, maltose regulon positive regulatory protein
MGKREEAAALLALKIAPPRARRWIVSRERLVRRFHSVRECAIICVQGPAGYGKTSLLARLRREWLATGACAAWLSLDADDDASRFVAALLFSAYTALGRPAPIRAVEHALHSGVEPREAIATLLGELSEAATRTALVLDDVHAMPPAVASELLPYLAFNLPPNVHLILGTRRRPPFATSELLAHGQFAIFDAADLSFRLEETRELLRARFGERVDPDTVASVQERVEGWPMGLQLVLAYVEKEADPIRALRRVATAGSGLDSLFVDVILPRLDPGDVAFLTAIAPLEQFQAHLCAAITGRRDCAERLERLRNDTPVLSAVEGSEWLRLHATCREALLRRFDELPKGDRLAMHWRAAQWLNGAGMLERAAYHALAAERTDTAYAWIAQALYGLMTSGRIVAARDWLQRLPESIVLGNDRLRLVAAWACALSHQPRDAFPLTEPLIEPSVDPALRYEALQIRGAAAHHADDFLVATEVSQLVGEDNPFGTPVVREVNAVLRSVLALSRGDTVEARMELAKLDLPAKDDREDYANYFAEFFAGVSYLLDARPAAAAQGLEPALARASSTFGRRSPPACLIAAALAAAALDQDQGDAAEAALANRLDVIERTAVPEAIALAYLTLARVALGRRDVGRVHDLLEGLYTMGVRRRQPRMIATSLAEQVRVEAVLQRANACAQAIARLREQRDAWRAAERGVGEIIDWTCGVAEIHAALCARHADAAREQCMSLLRSPSARWTRGRLEVMTLQCAAERMGGGSPEESLAEIRDTAAANGFARLLRELGPLAASEPRAAGRTATTPIVRTPVAARPAVAQATVVQCGLLTGKEREVLALLERNYSNKEIARALDVGPTTVKWHLRNLFGKLNVGGRRHAVQRARMLQLVEPEAVHP